MPTFHKSLAWYFVRSSVVVAIGLLPFLYLGRWLLTAERYPVVLQQAVEVVFAPATLGLGIVCQSMMYCIDQYYHGAGLVISLYVVSVIVYGYVISLMWGWVDVPVQSYTRPELPSKPRDYSPL